MPLHIEGMEEENLRKIPEVSGIEELATVNANSQEIQNEVG